MIPKLLHYCWFGENEIPAKEQKCIASWKKILPDFEIKLWNEKTFDVNICKYCSEAYKTKNYAFVSDYVRAYVLYKYGGIYLDTDVELFEGFRELFLEETKGFVGFERKSFIGTAVIAALPGNNTIQSLLEYYNSRSFLDKSGRSNIIANTSILTDILVKKGLVLGGQQQNLDGLKIFDRESFYPKKLEDGSFKITDKTLAVHRFSNSWLTDKERRRGTNKVWINFCRPVLKEARKFLLKICGKDRTEQFEIKLRNIMR